ncbi:MAG: thioredoxin [bacterium]
MSKVINVTEKDFTEVVIKSELPVLVDFWAPWCGPCVMMSPVLDQLAEVLGEKVKVVKVNINSAENQALAHQFDIMSIPALKIFKKGEVVKEFVGMIPLNMLKKDLEELI